MRALTIGGSSNESRVIRWARGVTMRLHHYLPHASRWTRAVRWACFGPVFATLLAVGCGREVETRETSGTRQSPSRSIREARGDVTDVDGRRAVSYTHLRAH